jgi:thiosulfate/3-mercaptopyruvate sulfurtransferase
VFFDVEIDVAAPGGGRGGPMGRHPWPPAEQVARVMSRAGIGDATRVVAYDDQSGAVAARLWYLLRANGHDAVSVLDGGIRKWIAETRPLETTVTEPVPEHYTPRPRPGWVVTKSEMVQPDPARLVLDARASERYRGEVEPIDPRAGHIPGARSAPFTENLTTDTVPVFRSGAELHARYDALGASAAEPVVYCGSGVTACHDLLALAVAGLRGRLYAGSWSEWSSDPALPIEKG